MCSDVSRVVCTFAIEHAANADVWQSIRSVSLFRLQIDAISTSRATYGMFA